jgi:thiol-disulfide isomerase/thioredoxin
MRDLGPSPACLCVRITRTVVRLLGGYTTALVVLAFVGAGGAAPGLAADQRQPVAPPLSLPDLDGRTRTLNEFLGSKPVLLEFMSTDCPHCRTMAPVLTRLHEVYGNRVSLLTVAFDRRATRVKAFAQVHGHSGTTTPCVCMRWKAFRHSSSWALTAGSGEFRSDRAPTRIWQGPSRT